MANINLNDPTEKRISLVYNSDISGFQALDFSKIDGIESLLTSGISVTANVGITSESDITQFGEWIANGFNAAQPTIAVIGSSAGQPFPISGTVTANVLGQHQTNEDQRPIPVDSWQIARVDASVDLIVPVQITNDSGTLNASNPLPICGTVTTIQQKSSNISNFIPSGTNGTVLAANLNRKELFVQNLQSGNLYVKYGTSAASNSFNFVLASTTASGGGDGGSLSDLNYTGIVSVSGLNSSYICWERS
jgi:hypothetical protein